MISRTYDGPTLTLEISKNGAKKAAVVLWRQGTEETVVLDEANLTAAADRARVLEAIADDEDRAEAAELLTRAGVELLALRDEPRADGAADAPALPFPTVEPWPEPVDGAALLAELVATIRRYVVLDEPAAVACALWVLHAWTLDAASISPFLALVSPTKRCGKTTLLTLLWALAPRPISASNISAAALFRAVEMWQPTLLVDEAETFLHEREELRGILNGGHTRATARVIRCEGDDLTPRVFSTWTPKVVAAIGTLPDTITDRSIVVHMRRKTPAERVERLRIDRPEALTELARRCARWAADAVEALRAVEPTEPEGLHDRAADNWRPLLAVAAVAGGPWSERARAAAIALSGGAPDTEDAAVQLLADLRELFEARDTEALTSESILAELTKREDRPWSEWSRGKPLTGRGLAKLLKRFGVAVKAVRFPNGTVAKGYARAWFSDAFERYLSPSQGSDRLHRLHDCETTTYAASRSVTTPGSVTDSESRNSLQDNDVTDVTDMTPGVAERSRDGERRTDDGGSRTGDGGNPTRPGAIAPPPGADRTGDGVIDPPREPILRPGDVVTRPDGSQELTPEARARLHAELARRREARLRADGGAGR